VWHRSVWCAGRFLAQRAPQPFNQSESKAYQRIKPARWPRTCSRPLWNNVSRGGRYYIILRLPVLICKHLEVLATAL
jgi:hypothetical protein